jgi:hypothetical protein
VKKVIKREKVRERKKSKNHNKESLAMYEDENSDSKHFTTSHDYQMNRHLKPCKIH